MHGFVVFNDWIVEHAFFASSKVPILLPIVQDFTNWFDVIACLLKLLIVHVTQLALSFNPPRIILHFQLLIYLSYLLQSSKMPSMFINFASLYFCI